MAQNLNSITISDPVADPNVSESGTFAFELTPGFVGGGGVNAYTLRWQWDQGTGAFVDIPASSAALTTGDTNPQTDLTSTTPISITVTGVSAGTYNIRGASGDEGILSSSQEVTVAASGSNVTPGGGEFQLVGAAPTASVTDHVTISVPSGELVLDSAAPAVGASITISPQVGALLTDSAEVAVFVPHIRGPPVAELALASDVVTVPGDGITPGDLTLYSWPLLPILVTKELVVDVPEVYESYAVTKRRFLPKEDKLKIKSIRPLVIVTDW